MLDSDEGVTKIKETNNLSTVKLWEHLSPFNGDQSLFTHNMTKQTFSYSVLASLLCMFKIDFTNNFFVTTCVEEFIETHINIVTFYKRDFYDHYTQIIMLH